MENKKHKKSKNKTHKKKNKSKQKEKEKEKEKENETTETEEIEKENEEIEKENEKEEIEKENEEKEKPTKMLIKNYSNLLHSPNNFADFKLIVGSNSVEIPCHKAILSFQCPFFKKILRKQETTSYSFDDFNPNIMMLVLDFIYTSQINLQMENVIQVYLLSQKILLDLLTQQSHNYILQNLNAELVLQIFQNQNQNLLQTFKEQIDNFIRDHFKELLRFKEFSDLPFNDLIDIAQIAFQNHYNLKTFRLLDFFLNLIKLFKQQDFSLKQKIDNKNLIENFWEKYGKQFEIINIKDKYKKKRDRFINKLKRRQKSIDSEKQKANFTQNENQIQNENENENENQNQNQSENENENENHSHKSKNSKRRNKNGNQNENHFKNSEIVEENNEKKKLGKHKSKRKSKKDQNQDENQNQSEDENENKNESENENQDEDKNEEEKKHKKLGKHKSKRKSKKDQNENENENEKRNHSHKSKNSKRRNKNEARKNRIKYPNIYQSAKILNSKTNESKKQTNNIPKKLHKTQILVHKKSEKKHSNHESERKLLNPQDNQNSTGNKHKSKHRKKKENKKLKRVKSHQITKSKSNQFSELYNENENENENDNENENENENDNEIGNRGLSPNPQFENIKVAILTLDHEEKQRYDLIKTLVFEGFHPNNIDDIFLENQEPIDLVDYHVVLVYSIGGSELARKMGDFLYEISIMGIPILIMFGIDVKDAIEGKFLEIIPYVPGEQIIGENQKLGEIRQPNHPIMKGINEIISGEISYHSDIKSKDENQVICYWNDNIPLVIVGNIPKKDESGKHSQIMVLNLFPPSSDYLQFYWSVSTDVGKLIANSLFYLVNKN
ncbi:rim-binding protein isoform f [Anaeramoeba ignava]|uniref:Rim-binding protein isoform f n=1 Tax=Anaeramoeba ignava TaxID=1746090 RepID=A0A9Q0LAZ2_ANAIG|nr:rim-binding protein isoform f [Anaeramoeba ignava]